MQRDINRLKNQNFDLLICGGGIYGAWTAYDAALRGLKVALVDKGDWANATSSASSKLIHGGLRYLETFDLKLVKKALAEREMLLKAAPHRVCPLRFGIPVYRGGRLGKFRLTAGLTLYDLLSGRLFSKEQHNRYAKVDFSNRFPCLDRTDLTGGFSYLDAQTDDARLVLELIDGACSAGAICVNYCQAAGFKEKEGKLSGATLQDNISGETLTIEAKYIADTTGRWSSSLQNSEKTYRLTKGIHLIMPAILPNEALLLTAKSDGRVFFVIPWYGLTLLGTTDTNYDGNLEQIPVLNEEIDYLLNEANQVFYHVNWTRRDIIGQFAGLRVLQQPGRNNPTYLSRDWTLKISENGLLCSIGGKLTSAREDAALIVDHVCERLNRNSRCQTSGKTFPWLSGIDYQTLLTVSMHRAKMLGIDTACATWLVKRHGVRAGAIFDLCGNKPELTQRILPDLPFIQADLEFCLQNEMCVHLDDLLRRRLPLLLLAKLTEDKLSQLARTAAEILGWDSVQTFAEIKRCLII